MSVKESKEPSFPRSAKLPTQSSKFWVKEKDRYLRQLLIGDIEAATGRPLLVYFMLPSEMIVHEDAEDISEILQGVEGDTLDIVIQTPGGQVDAVEKLITVLRNRFGNNYRVFVPSLAKSGGTVIAISAAEIVLGMTSELGPIDPQLPDPRLGGSVPCDLIAQDGQLPQTYRMLATQLINRLQGMASKYLADGMFKGIDQAQIDAVVKKLASSPSYNSHGAVIDYSEAKSLGLNVSQMEHTDELWRQIWMLYCMYEFDCKRSGYGRIIEGCKYSIARRATPHK